MASEFTPAGIAEWLHDHIENPTTRNHYRRDLRTMFAYALMGAATARPPHERRGARRHQVTNLSKARRRALLEREVPHPVDDLVQAEPIMDAKLTTLDPRKLSRLRRIARLERGFCGEAEW